MRKQSIQKKASTNQKVQVGFERRRQVGGRLPPDSRQAARSAPGPSAAAQPQISPPCTPYNVPEKTKYQQENIISSFSIVIQTLCGRHTRSLPCTKAEERMRAWSVCGLCQMYQVVELQLDYFEVVSSSNVAGGMPLRMNIQRPRRLTGCLVLVCDTEPSPTSGMRRSYQELPA